jgi:glycine cleavage system transcriptional repressor
VSKRYVITLTAANRTGILAAVTTALAELGGDIHEASLSVIQQFFSIILAADFPDRRDAEVIKSHLEGVCRPFGVEVILKDPALEPLQQAPPQGTETYLLTLTGHDTPGVMARISARLAREQIDITDLHGVRRDGDRSFVMTLKLAVPPGVDLPAMRAEIEELGTKIGFSARLERRNESPNGGAAAERN